MVYFHDRALHRERGRHGETLAAPRPGLVASPAVGGTADAYLWRTGDADYTRTTVAERMTRE